MTKTQTGWLRALPKVELHVHLEGAIRPDTAVDLARQNGVELPEADPSVLYNYQELGAFLAVYNLIAECVRAPDDFRRITYEMLESAAGSGARYVEFFISPHAHPEVPFASQFEGIRAGMREAQQDFSIESAIIPGINRELGPGAAEEYLDLVLDNRGEDVIGIGLDYFEAPYPPEPFAPVFQRARKAGLHLTAHAGEAGPASFIEASLDVLGVERVDHGYAIVDDPALLQRCQDDGVLFTCCPSTTTYTTIHRDLSAVDHPIRRMNEAGLTLCLNSDDPPMFRTDLCNEYVRAVDELGFTRADIERSIFAGLEHAWIDDSTRRAWKAEWQREIAGLI